MGFNSPSLNPENVQVQYLQKIALRAENPAAPSVFYYLDTVYFLHEVQFSAAIEAAHFPADLRNAALSAFEEGAPFMGTALAAYKQCIDASAAAIFTFLKIFRDPEGFSGLRPFFSLQNWRLFSLLQKATHSHECALMV